MDNVKRNRGMGHGMLLSGVFRFSLTIRAETIWKVLGLFKILLRKTHTAPKHMMLILAPY